MDLKMEMDGFENVEVCELLFVVQQSEASHSQERRNNENLTRTASGNESC